MKSLVVGGDQGLKFREVERNQVLTHFSAILASLHVIGPRAVVLAAAISWQTWGKMRNNLYATSTKQKESATTTACGLVTQQRALELGFSLDSATIRCHGRLTL